MCGGAVPGSGEAPSSSGPGSSIPITSGLWKTLAPSVLGGGVGEEAGVGVEEGDRGGRWGWGWGMGEGGERQRRREREGNVLIYSSLWTEVACRNCFFYKKGILLRLKGLLGVERRSSGRPWPCAPETLSPLALLASQGIPHLDMSGLPRGGGRPWRLQFQADAPKAARAFDSNFPRGWKGDHRKGDPTPPGSHRHVLEP